MRKTIHIIESISEWTGKIFMWSMLILVVLLCHEVFMRYILDNPTIYSYEISTMLGVIIGTGALAYTHLRHGHVRVDVIWRNLSPKGQAISDAVGSLVFFWPLMLLLVWTSFDWVIYSYSVHEISQESYLYPIVWPVRAVMLLGFILIIPQDMIKFIRNIDLIRGKKLS